MSSGPAPPLDRGPTDPEMLPIFAGPHSRRASAAPWNTTISPFTASRLPSSSARCSFPTLIRPPAPWPALPRSALPLWPGRWAVFSSALLATGLAVSGFWWQPSCSWAVPPRWSAPCRRMSRLVCGLPRYWCLCDFCRGSAREREQAGATVLMTEYRPSGVAASSLPCRSSASRPERCCSRRVHLPGYPASDYYCRGYGGFPFWPRFC